MSRSTLPGRATRKTALLGIPVVGALLAVPFTAGPTLAAPGPAAAPSTTSVSASGVTGVTIEQSGVSSSATYWTKTRMAAAKPLSLTVQKGASSAKAAPSAKTGSTLTVHPTNPSGPVAKAAVEKALSGPTASVFARAYSYPAPFTRFETFPASNYTVWPNQTVGKLFFTDANRKGYVCSASVVNSENKDVVWTAGHCLSNGRRVFYRNFAFVPAYRDGAAPLGVWTPRQVWVRSEWHQHRNFRQDIGALVMNRDGERGDIANHVGALGITFNGSRVRHWNSMGYPHAAPFTGQWQFQNMASYASSDNPGSRPGPYTIGVGSDYTGGSSGGPWIYRYGPGGGYVNGHNDYKYTNRALEMYSPYYGNEAKSLYNVVRDK